MDVYAALVIMHIIGTVLGVGGATFAEINLVRALRDGEISPDETALMRGTYAVLRLGFFLLVVSGFGFLVYFRLEDMTHLLYSEKLWAKLTIIGILSANSALLGLRWIPLLWGAAISLTAWYAALILGVLRGPELTYFLVLAVFAVAVVIVYFALRFVHKKFAPNNPFH